jgi:hypothetical protein
MSIKCPTPSTSWLVAIVPFHCLLNSVLPLGGFSDFKFSTSPLLENDEDRLRTSLRSSCRLLSNRYQTLRCERSVVAPHFQYVQLWWGILIVSPLEREFSAWINNLSILWGQYNITVKDINNGRGITVASRRRWIIRWRHCSSSHRRCWNSFCWSYAIYKSR